MERETAIFADGIGAAAATSGVLNQLQGRIFGLLYLSDGSLSLEDIAAELQQSKSNISMNIRGLVEWHLVSRVHVAGSRKDHYEAATNLVRVMQEISERRFRWNMRQVLTTTDETERAIGGEHSKADKDRAVFVRTRLGEMRAFFSMLDTMIGLFTPGQPFPPSAVENVLTPGKATPRQGE